MKQYIDQKQLTSLKEKMTLGKVHVVYGPRRCGKTTLLQQLVNHLDEPYLWVSGEDVQVQSILSSQSIEALKLFIGSHRYLVIDEAQKIEGIGLNLKLIVDHIPDLYVVVTGSSVFDLSQKLGEPLVGRKLSFPLYPLSQMELMAFDTHSAQTQARLEQRMIYGAYPEVVLMEDHGQRVEYLSQLVSSALYRDILELDSVRNSSKLAKLLKLLAFQVGNEVSIAELGRQLGMSKNTVDRYLDLLEKCYVIFSLGGFSRNLRKEVTKSMKYYFYDIGIRNALISNFNSFEFRNDLGALWENYVIMERIKRQQYTTLLSNNYFWRTYDQKEIDWIEEREGCLFAYEMKWNQDKKVIWPRAFCEAYSDVQMKVIHPGNYLEFVVGEGRTWSK